MYTIRLTTNRISFKRIQFLGVTIYHWKLDNRILFKCSEKSTKAKTKTT